MTDEQKNDDSDADLPEHVHGAEHGERPDDFQPYESGEVGRDLGERRDDE